MKVIVTCNSQHFHQNGLLNTNDDIFYIVINAMRNLMQTSTNEQRTNGDLRIRGQSDVVKVNSGVLMVGVTWTATDGIVSSIFFLKNRRLFSFLIIALCTGGLS